MYKYNVVFLWFKKSLSASFLVRELTDRELVCRRIVQYTAGATKAKVVLATKSQITQNTIAESVRQWQN